MKSFFYLFKLLMADGLSLGADRNQNNLFKTHESEILHPCASKEKIPWLEFYAKSRNLIEEYPSAIESTFIWRNYW